MTWPVGKEALQAAARKRREILRRQVDAHDWDKLRPKTQDRLIEEEAEIFRAAFENWEISWKQAMAAHEAGLRTDHQDKPEDGAEWYVAVIGIFRAALVHTEED